MFDTAIAGSLPEPAWLAETRKLWPRWKAEDADLAQAKLELKSRVHAVEAQFLRVHTQHRIKCTLPGPLTIVDTVAETIARSLQFVPREHLIACTHCGLQPMSRVAAEAKLAALAQGAALAAKRRAES